MLFDLINLSDNYTFKADTLECAAMATWLLGSGQYAARQVGGDAEVPFFMLGGSNEWFRQNCGMTIEDAMNIFIGGERSAELVACLRSVLIGDRAEYERTLPMIADDKREAWIAGWHDKHRSSINDIGTRARHLADSVVGGAPLERAPQQVFIG